MLDLKTDMLATQNLMQITHAVICIKYLRNEKMVISTTQDAGHFLKLKLLPREEKLIYYPGPAARVNLSGGHSKPPPNIMGPPKVLGLFIPDSK